MPPPTQDLESPPHPEVELLLPGETPLTGQSSEGRNEGASGPGAQQPSGEPPDLEAPREEPGFLSPGVGWSLEGTQVV